jgi:hypothetical protein
LRSQHEASRPRTYQGQSQKSGRVYFQTLHPHKGRGWFFLFSFQWLSGRRIILIKGDRKEKKTEKKKSQLYLSPNPEGPVDRLYWAFQILEVPVENWGWKGSQKYTVSLP